MYKPYDFIVAFQDGIEKGFFKEELPDILPLPEGAYLKEFTEDSHDDKLPN